MGVIAGISAYFGVVHSCSVQLFILQIPHFSLVLNKWTFLNKKEFGMLTWALIFLVVAIIAGLFGFRGIASTAVDIARILFFLFIVIFVVLLILSFFGAGTPSPAAAT
ncbi:Small integral membrane protein [Legionella massiliensis]|uniref:UPF0391 membrane protein BN59_02285 n=2 Tax=Legionella massiliensis TaxID=1034943 RepID=A0A078L1U5_9GAMM|nr:Small integral membrane protein [Legionella massiliensis]CEE13727.1 hypothetical protein BN1094_02285 [Legionella massiliensis]